MANNKKIVLIDYGRHIEIDLTTGITPKPGQHVVVTTTGKAILPAAANGALGENILLQESSKLGFTVSEAYPDSAVADGYIAQPGAEVLVLVASGQTIVIGDLGVVQTATGKVIKTAGTEPTRTYVFLEASGGALAADKLLLARKL